MEDLPGRINGVPYPGAPEDGWIHLAQCLAPTGHSINT